VPAPQTTCVFCLRDVPTRGHHIVPKSKGGRVIKPTCEPCESFIHRTFTHKELRDTYNTVESIQKHEGYQRHLKWLLKQQPQAVFRSARKRR
jgi:hypothetical protein